MIFKIGENLKHTQFDNVPVNYDKLLFVSPKNFDFEQGVFQKLSFKANVVDFNTGKPSVVYIKKTPVYNFSSSLVFFNRQQFNIFIQFLYSVEGMYINYWGSLLEEEFMVCNYAPFKLDDLGDLFKIGGANYFYAVNWGQKDLAWLYAKRLLAFISKDFTFCHFNRVTEIVSLPDPRVIQVRTQFEIPEMNISDLGLVTTFKYVVNEKDEFRFNYITDEIILTTLEVREDIANLYNPYEELSPIYPGSN